MDLRSGQRRFFGYCLTEQMNIGKPFDEVKALETQIHSLSWQGVYESM